MITVLLVVGCVNITCLLRYDALKIALLFCVVLEMYNMDIIMRKQQTNQIGRQCTK